MGVANFKQDLGLWGERGVVLRRPWIKGSELIREAAWWHL